VVTVPPPFDFAPLRKAGESARVEFKAGPNSDLREAVCALANDLEGSAQPGFLLIGLHDDGSPAGLRIDDATLQKLAQIRSDGMLQPLPSLAITKASLPGGDVAVIEVQPTDDPPMRHRGRIWVRVGPTTQVASAQDERRLVERRHAMHQPFDHTVVHSARLEDPLAFAPEVLERNERTAAERLEALRLAHAEMPTIAGVIVLAPNPRLYVPGAYIQFVRFAGSDVTSPIQDQREIIGKISDVLSDVVEVLKINNQVALSIGDAATDVKRPQYSVAALQELAVNAVLHRRYDGTNAPSRLYFFEDRVEITNPGGLFGAVRQRDLEFGGVNDYRNPVLADALKTLGFAQRFGFGIPFVRKALLANGNLLPEFDAQPEYFRVTVRAA